jgi:hypothetical protein
LRYRQYLSPKKPHCVHACAGGGACLKRAAVRLLAMFENHSAHFYSNYIVSFNLFNNNSILFNKFTNISKEPCQHASFFKNQTRFSEETSRANLSERVATTAPSIWWANLTRQPNTNGRKKFGSIQEE